MNSTKTGGTCHTCRRNRWRCDATKPSCNKCAKRGVECLGYGQQPFLWVQTPATKSNSQVSKRGKGRPKLVLMAQSSDEDGNYQDKGFATSQSVSAELVPVGYYRDRLALSSFQYFNNYMVNDMVIIDSSKNPHRSDLASWQYIPDLLRDMVIASALTHQILRCHSTQDSFPFVAGAGNEVVHVNRNRMASWQNPSMPVIYKHQRNLLKALSELIADTELRYSDIVLGIVIGLIRVEIQQSAFGAWSVHLNAARKIIDKRGGFKRLVQTEHVLMAPVLTTYMLFDIMSAVFTPCKALDTKNVKSQLEYIPLLDVDFKHGRDCDFPCGNQLLEAIIRINHVRLISHTAANVKLDLEASCAQIFYRIASFDPVSHSRALLHQLLPWPTPPSPPSAESSSEGEAEMDERHRAVYDMCEDLGRSYQYAVMLYCLRTLYVDRGKLMSGAFASPPATSLIAAGKMCIDVERPQESALECLLDSLQRLWEAEKHTPDWVGKYTFWPLWVAGMELASGHCAVDTQRFICKSLQKLCYYLGDLGPLDAVSALQLVWAKTAHGAEASWDDRLVMPGMQGVFFV